ncbi:MAG: aldehyde dehydrogenase [Spirochaetota bacterium]
MRRLTMTAIQETISLQKKYFLTDATKDIPFRIRQLKKLKSAVKANETRILDALKDDLGKSATEAYMTEIGIVYAEIDHQIKGIKKWGSPRRVRNNLINMDARCYINPEPFGVVLIMAPWNYPFQLVMAPLAGAIAAGNCAVIKPADYSQKTSEVMRDIIEAAFSPEYISVFLGNRAVNQALLEERYDLICFTGSPSLGKYVMEKASRFLTPVILELGGKSPCIIDADADIRIAARRLAFGKFTNAGQTCISPDYVYVHKSVKDKLIEALKSELKNFFGDNPEESPDFGRIINDRQYGRLKALLSTGTAVLGGTCNDAKRYIAPTIFDNVHVDDPIMQEEIFGPILPIMTFSGIDEVVRFVNSREKPLALYYFSQNRKKQREITRRTTSGGMCINDTLMHITNPHLPFGGVGNSGMGRYHGKFSFDTFSNLRAVVARGTLIDFPVRYAPFKPWVLKAARFIFE